MNAMKVFSYAITGYTAVILAFDLVTGNYVWAIVMALCVALNIHSLKRLK